MHLSPSLCPDWIVLCVCSWLVHVWLFLSGITSGPPCPHVTRTNQTRSSDQLFSDDVQITVFHSSPSAVVDVLQQDNSRKGVFVLTDCYFPPPLQLSVNVPSTTDVGWKTARMLCTTAAPWQPVIHCWVTHHGLWSLFNSSGAGARRTVSSLVNTVKGAEQEVSGTSGGQVQRVREKESFQLS